MRHKDSSKSFGMSCFGCLFKKKHSRSRKGKNTSGSSRSTRGTSKNLFGNSKRSQSSKNDRKKSHGSENVVETEAAVETKNIVVQRSHGADRSDRMIELRKKIMSFRELVDLPPCIGSSTVIELVKHTVKELQKLHSDVIHCSSLSDSDITMDEAINELCTSIKSLGMHWMHNDEWMVKSKKDDEANGDLEKHALALLDDIINVARAKMYNKMDTNNDKDMKDNVDSPSSSDKSSSRSHINKIYPHVVEGDEDINENGNPDCNVRVQMEISIPSSSLKSIVDLENIKLILADGSPSSSSERPSISASIVSSPPPLPDSEATQPQPQPQSPPTSLGDLPRPPPSPPPLPSQPLISVGEGGTGTPVPPPPPPPPSKTISNATSISSPPPPPPPSLMVTRNTTSPPSITISNATTPPPPPPPPPSGNGMHVSLGSHPPPPPAPTSTGSIPPPPPPAPTTTGSIPLPPPPPAPPSDTSSEPVQEDKGGAPPPPPAVATGGRLLRKSASKLRRSSQMGCLYRQLKAKVEGSGSKTKLQRKDSKVGAASSGGEKKGMADALAEMTRRSSYFQQIEEDVINYSDSIKEVKAALISFETTDMDELINFHEYVESLLEKLTDETQVLARFEDFPSKKLEGLRMAATLYSKLDAIAINLQTWNIEPPANQLIDRIENYFNKIKEELDTLDRTKDEEIKKFKSQKIHFDFAILIRIKELMVDLSSSCMELALKERKLASASRKNGKKVNAGKVLWQAFQFAFRVYSFAGGHDDRAENLTKEVAQLIQADNVQ